MGELPGTKIVDSKQLIPFAYTSLLGIFIANKDYEDSLFWAEPISGKVLWGTDRRQVGQLMHAYVIDIDRNIAEKKFQPENLETKQWHPLLELADLLAYCTSFAVANKGVTLTRYGDRVKMSIFNSMAPNISTFTWLDGPTGMWSNLSLSN